MGLGPAAVKLNLDLWQRGFLKNINSVIEMGSQELCLTLTDFEELINIAAVSNFKKEKFAALINWPGIPRCPSKLFYEILGVKKYSCIDIGGEHAAVSLDLNFPLEDAAFYGQYDLVTDYGNNEHVFNTAEAFRTMHRLCREKGFIIIAQALYNSNGYYAYEPCFFEGIAAANKYDIIFSSYVVVTKTKTSSGSDNEFHIPLSSELLDALDWTKVDNIGIYYCMQKQTNSDFRYPYQGRLLANIQKHYGYQLQFLSNPPSRAYIPIAMDGISGKTLLKLIFKKVIKKIVARAR